MLNRFCCCFCLAPLVLVFACARPQIPPGPAPEYERPRVMAWDAGPQEDPLSAIEAEGEWVEDDAPSMGAGGAPPEPSDSKPATSPDATPPTPAPRPSE